MSDTRETNVLPPWEKLLQRLHLNEGSLSVSESQMLFLRAITDLREDTKGALAKTVITVPRLMPLQASFLVKSTAEAITLLETNLGRKKAVGLLNSAFLHRLTTTKTYTEKRLPAEERKRQDKYEYAICFPVGDRATGFQFIFLAKEELAHNDEVFLKLVRNILTLRHQQSLLREEINREAESLTLLTHHLSEGMAVLNQDMKVTLWNRPMQRLSGYSPREAVGQPYQAVFKRTDAEDWLGQLMNVYLETPLRNVFNTQFEIVTREGTRRWVDVSGSFMRRPTDNTISQTIIIVRDVSHLKMLEQRKNEFISIATHELRTPITAIKGYLSLLHKDQENLTDKQRTYLGRANDANHRLARLAEDLLRTVQVEEDRLRINLRPVELGPILEKITRDLQEKAKAKQLTLEYVAAPFDTWVTADEEKIEQVFANLIDNAIKYTSQGYVRVFTDRFEENGQSFIIVHVQDTGIGINPKNYEAIFEKFRRTHDTAEIRESGAGLGLFIVKSFVEKQGGKISVNSRIGNGTTFSVRLQATESPKPLHDNAFHKENQPKQKGARHE